jgi:hypothetical protein
MYVKVIKVLELSQEKNMQSKGKNRQTQGTFNYHSERKKNTV